MTLTRIVEELGKLEPDRIAGKFRRAGIKGHLFGSTTCPVSAYLRKLTKLDFVSVGAGVVNFNKHHEIVRELQLPESVSEFISRFDELQYLDLVVGGTDA